MSKSSIYLTKLPIGKCYDCFKQWLHVFLSDYNNGQPTIFQLPFLDFIIALISIHPKLIQA